MTPTPEYTPTVIAQSPAAPAPYAGLGTPGLTPVQQGWLQLADAKQQLFQQLQAGELKVQQLLNVLPNVTPDQPDALANNLKVLQTRIADAKKIAAEYKEMRLAFTGMLTDRIFKPAMEFEQRSAKVIDTAAARELEMRKAAAAIAERDADIKREENALVVHISNEQYRVANDYRQALMLRIHQFYIACLNAKTQAPDFKDLAEALRAIQPGDMRKFERKLVSYDRAVELLNGMTPYDPNTDLQEALGKWIADKFAMYSEDLKNAEAAAKRAEQEVTQQVQEATEKTDLAMATNTLMGQAETARVDAPRVKRKLEAVEENSQAWAFAVLAAFIKNSAASSAKLRTKTWAKVSIGQMAKALAEVAGETGEQFQGVPMKEVEK